MECWKQGCKNKIKVFCECTNPPTYSCSVHIYGHLQIASTEKHRPEPLNWKINPEIKKALIDELNKQSKELFNIQKNLIQETCKKIEELQLSLMKALDDIEEAIRNQVSLKRRILSIKKIPKINQDPVEKLLSLDLDSALKKLDEFGCNFNHPDFEFNKKTVKINDNEDNEIV